MWKHSVKFKSYAEVGYLLPLLLLLFDLNSATAPAWEGLMIVLIPKWQHEKGRFTCGLKKKHKTYFLIPSIEVSENVQQTNKKPQAFCCSQDIFFKLLKWYQIKSLWKLGGLTYNSRALILKLKKGIIGSLLVVFNSFKLQEDHLVNYLFQGTKWHLKGLKVLNHLPKVVSLALNHW